MLPKWIFNIIAYNYQISQRYIGIINHGSNLFWIPGSADRQPTLKSDKNCFIFIFIKQILWQVLCHGSLIFLLSSWRMENNFVDPSFVSCSSWKWFLGFRIWYCNKMPILWVYVDILQQILVRWWRWTISPKGVSALIFFNSIRNISIKSHIL